MENNQEILDTLEELKQTTSKISKMLQLIVYNLFDVEEKDDDEPTKKFQEQTNLDDFEEEDYNEKYRRTYLG